jgi:hypothetical protein
MLVFLLFSSCTKMIMSVDKKQDFKIKETLLIVTRDDPSIRDFIISLKNYLALNIESHNIKVTKHNILQDEQYDVAIPNLQYIMDIKAEDISTSFKNQIIGKASFVINIQDYKTKEIVWTSRVLIKRVFDSDKIYTAKKISKNIADKLDKALIFN